MMKCIITFLVAVLFLPNVTLASDFESLYSRASQVSGTEESRRYDVKLADFFDLELGDILGKCVKKYGGSAKIKFNAVYEIDGSGELIKFHLNKKTSFSLCLSYGFSGEMVPAPPTEVYLRPFSWKGRRE